MNMQSNHREPRGSAVQRHAAFALIAGACLAFWTGSCASPIKPVELAPKVADPLLRPQLNQATRPLWRDHILAPKTELAWEEIPWRPSFLTGLREAGERGMPLLLWVMNGHPLGCT